MHVQAFVFVGMKPYWCILLQHGLGECCQAIRNRVVDGDLFLVSISSFYSVYTNGIFHVAHCHTIKTNKLIIQSKCE
jgi:hypothetical protein